jgi:hypothetical protein
MRFFLRGNGFAASLARPAISAVFVNAMFRPAFASAPFSSLAGVDASKLQADPDP